MPKGPVICLFVASIKFQRKYIFRTSADKNNPYVYCQTKASIATNKRYFHSNQ